MAISIKVEVKENKTKEVLDEMKRQAGLALNAIGLTAEGYAKEDCPVDTGRLRNSINYATADSSGSGEDAPLITPEELALYIGTNVEYAQYVEEGDQRHTVGKKHFIRDAVSYHSEEYKNILEASLKA